MATRIVAPNVWALVADRTGMRSELIKLGAFAAALTYLSFFYHGGFLYLALSLALYTFFWNAILAQLEVITLETLGAEANKYGLIRSFGSVGYIVLVVGTGWAIKEFGPEVLLYVGLSLFLGLLGSALPLPSNRASAGAVQNKPALKLGRPLLWFYCLPCCFKPAPGLSTAFSCFISSRWVTQRPAPVFLWLSGQWRKSSCL